MHKIITIWIILVFVSIFFSCSGGDENNPIEPSTSSIIGTWKTDGIYPISSDYGADVTFIVDQTTYKMTVNGYKKNNSGEWVFDETKNITAKYEIDYSFIILYDEFGATDDDNTFHFQIDGNKLTLNSIDNFGGIYKGNSNTLTGQLWTFIYSKKFDGQLKFRDRLLRYNPDGTGIRISRGDVGGEFIVDTTLFTYSINENIITHFWQDEYLGNHPYLGIYEIKNNKLYMYGKPRARDEEAYTLIEFLRNN